MKSQFTSIKQAYLLPVGSEITLRGWVRSRRDSKGITFIELNDGSRFRSLQLVVESGVAPDETLKDVTTGSSIAASGVLVESPSARPSACATPSPAQFTAFFRSETSSTFKRRLSPPRIAKVPARCLM